MNLQQLISLHVFSIMMIHQTAFSADWTQILVERTVNAHYEIEIPTPDTINRHFWYTSPPNLSYQTVISKPSFSVTPSSSYLDSVFGNEIRYWNYSTNDLFKLQMDWTIKVKNVLTSIDPVRVESYDLTDPEYQLYTRSERLTRINPTILEIKNEIEKTLYGEKNPAIVAKATYFWVLDHMAYSLLDSLKRDRGTDELVGQPFQYGDLTYYKGDCGEYTLLYNAILRAFGIPARTVTGGWSLGSNQWHVWSEILIPGYGWIPVDTSASDVFVYDEGAALNNLGEKHLGTFPNVSKPDFYFGNLDPFRFVMSIGNDIPLEPALDWDFSADYHGWYYNHGVVGYIQLGIFNLNAKETKILIRFSG